MSSNLVKQMFTVVSSEDRRVIDTSTLIQQRLEEYNQKQKQKETKGFTAGLIAEEILVAEGDETEEQLGYSEIMDRAGQEVQLMLDRAREEADSILAEARAKALQLCEDAKTQAEVEKNRVIAEARQAGYQEGLNQAKMEGEAVKQEYIKKENEAEAFYQQQIDLLEPMLVETITDIYEHIFHVELHSYREVLSFLISSTLRKIDGGHDFIVHVSKEDYPYVNMQKKQIIAGAVTGNSTVEILEDITLAKNDCLIETENGIFDCGLGTQMTELKHKIQLLSWTKEE